MLFKEIIDGNFRCFSRQKDEERTRNIQTIKYIQNMASLAAVDISDWNAKELFGTGTGHKFITDNNEINRIFFSEMDRRASMTPADPNSVDLLDAAAVAAIKVAEARHVAKLVADETTRATSQMREAMNYYDEHMKRVKLAAEHFAIVRRLSNVSENGLEQQVRQIAANTFYQFLGMVDGSRLHFITANDIILRHVNPAAGIDIQLNFGRFNIYYNVQTFSLEVKPRERNILLDNFPHPHVNYNGGVCWGSAAQTATHALARMQIVEPFMLLSALLITYNPSNPYRSIERFQELLGTPEEQHARDVMNSIADERRAVFQAADRAELDYTRVRAVPVDNPTWSEEGAPAPIVVTPEVVPLAAPDQPVAATLRERLRERSARAAEVADAVPDTVTPVSLHSTPTVSDDDIAF